MLQRKDIRESPRLRKGIVKIAVIEDVKSKLKRLNETSGR